MLPAPRVRNVPKCRPWHPAGCSAGILPALDGHPTTNRGPGPPIVVADIPHHCDGPVAGTARLTNAAPYGTVFDHPEVSPKSKPSSNGIKATKSKYGMLSSKELPARYTIP